MKKIKFIFICFAALLTISANAHHHIKDDGWKERMMSEKIAFLTMQLEITPEEAQVFWPIYNQINSERDEAMCNVHKAYKVLKAALEEEKSEKEIEEALNAYIECFRIKGELDQNAPSRYRKVLSVEKVAKLYVAEEKFRKIQIRKLHQKEETKKEEQ